MLYFIIWLLVLGASVYFFQRSAGSLSPLKPNMNSIIFYYSFFISSYIGSLLIAMDIDGYYMINKLTHEEYRTIGFIAVSFVMLVFPLVMFLVSKLVGFDAEKELDSYLRQEIVVPFGNNREFFLIFAGLSFISLAAIAYTMLKTPHIPILELVLRNTDLSPGELRIEAQRNFGGNVLIRNIFAIALTPLMSLIAYVYMAKTRDPKWILLFWALFSGTILISTYDLAKSPIFFYMIMFLLVGMYIGKIRFTWAKLIRWGITGLILLIGMYIVIQGVTDLESYLSYNSGPVGRLIFAQIAPTFLHLNIFGEAIPYLDGRGLPSAILRIFDMEQVRSARVVMSIAFPEKIEAGTAGVLNTLFIAEAFANFGYFGIFAGTVYIAFLVQVIYIVFLRLPKNPIFISLFVYFSINIPRTLVGGFSDFLFNPIWILVTGLFTGLLLLIRLRIDLTALWLRRKSRTEL
jgi:oligosaccharide repeat unit polymerase